MLPLFTPMKPEPDHEPGSVAEGIMQRAQARQAERVAGLSDEQLRKIELQIQNLKERGSRGEDVGVRLRELRREHYQANGADGG